MGTEPGVAAYLDGFDAEVRARLERVRGLVSEVAPDAAEAISYGMLGWKLHGTPLVYAGGFARHVGLYALPDAHEAFAEELAGYRGGKGSVQLPLAEPFPENLVRRILQHRVVALG